jgi:cyanophycinase-like exopeptidase
VRGARASTPSAKTISASGFAARTAATTARLTHGSEHDTSRPLNRLIASSLGFEAGQRYREIFNGLGIDEVRPLHAMSRSQANDEAYVRQLDGATSTIVSQFCVRADTCRPAMFTSVSATTIAAAQIAPDAAPSGTTVDT